MEEAWRACNSGMLKLGRREGKLDKRVDSRELQNVHLMLRYARVMMSSLFIVNAIQVFLVVATIACGLLLRRSNRKLHEQLQAARQQPLQD